MSGTTAQDGAWGKKESADEAAYIHQKEQAQLAALREQLGNKTDSTGSEPPPKSANAKLDRDFEGGFGGQEDLEDRYATTSGEH